MGTAGFASALTVGTILRGAMLDHSSSCYDEGQESPGVNSTRRTLRFWQEIRDSPLPYRRHVWCTRMAPRRPPAPPVVPQLPSLVFNQSLKGCTNTEYLKRLKALHHELSLIEQDNVLVSSLDKVAKELISHSLLLHKEKGVKAFLGCCLVDILRLYAPDAPYTPGEIKVSRIQAHWSCKSGV